MPLDRAKLVKLLMMTQSGTDAEVISAMRHCNRMLHEAGVDWTGLVSGSRAKLVMAQDPPDYVRPAPRKSIDEAFEFLGEHGCLDDQSTGLGLMFRQWQKHRKLSPESQSAIFDRVYHLEKAAPTKEWEPE